MRFGARWVASGAWWMLPVCMGLGVAILLVDGSVFDPSAASTATLGSSSVVVIAPVVAGGAVWSTGQLRRAGWWRRASARRSLGVVADLLWPHVLCGAAGLAASLATAMATYGVWRLPDPRPVVAALAMVVAAAVSGAALGRLVREVVALPVAIGGWYYVLAFPPALEPTWLRHLVVVRDCCLVGRSLDTSVVVAVVATAVAVTGASLGLLVPVTQHPAARLAGPLVAVLALAAAVGLVHARDADPTSPRRGELTCSGDEGRIRLCVWPEHAAELARLERVVTPALRAVAAETGVPAPTVLTQDEQADQDAGERFFAARPTDSDDDLERLGGAAAFPTLSATCVHELEAAGRGDGPVPPEAASALYEAQYVGTLWWTTRTVLAASDLPLSRGPGEARALAGSDPPPSFSHVWDADADGQARWLSAVTDAVLACDPNLVPGGER